MNSQTTHIKTEKQLVPQLRFKEYGVEWQYLPLIETIDKNIKWSFTGGPFGSDLKSDDYTEEGVRILQLQNIGDGEFIDNYRIYTSNQKANILKSCNIYPGEIIISKMGDPVARACKIPTTDERYVMASDGIRFVPDENRFDKDFLFHSINHPYFRNKALSLSTGSTRKRIGLTELKKIKFTIPTLPEQQKIASFLTAVDTKLQQLNQKKELLQQYKKGVMQQLFSQQLRFRQYDGSDYPDWEEKRLGILTYKVGKKNKDNIAYPIYSINNQEGFLPQSEQFEGLDSSNRGYDISMYKIIYPETFAYNPARINVGSIGYSYDLDGVIVSSLYVCFKTKDELDDKYLLAYLDSYNFNKDVLRFQEGGVRQYLFYENFSAIKIPLPSLEEQQQIARYLSALDTKIETLTQQIESTQQFKKGLLQQMFV